jgi:hypothetical protein
MNTNYGAGGYGTGNYSNQPIETLPIGYYLNLVTHEYRSSPKFNKLLYTLLKKFDDVSQCLVQMDTALNLSLAYGSTLDMLGRTAGALRTLPFQPSYGVSPIMDDTTYRTYIQAKIAQNQWDGTITSLYFIWKSLFPTVSIIIADNQNMSATLFIGGLPSSLIIDMVAGYAVNGATSGTVQNGLIVPRPEGVLYEFFLGSLPAFGFDLDNSYVAGFDVGKWSA